MTAIAKPLTAHLRQWLFILAALGAALFPAAASAQEFNPETVRARLDTIRTVLDYVETGIKADARRSELQRLRDSIEPFRNELQRHIEGLTPRLGEIDTRLKALGPEPGKDAPADSPDVAAERKRIGNIRGEIDGLIKQARVQLTRTDQIVDRIEEVRRNRLTNRLFERTFSVLDPKLWLEAAAAVPAEIKQARDHLAEWFGTVSQLPQAARNAGLALAASIAAVFGIFLLQGWLRRRAIAAAMASESGKFVGLLRAKAALRDAVLNAAALPLAVFAVIGILTSFDFIVGDGHRVALGVLVAVTLFATGRALAGALLRPREAPRRVFNLSDETAGRFYYYLTGALGIATAGAALNVVHRSLEAPRVLVMLTSALMATAVAVILIRLLMKTRQIADESAEEPAPNWLRFTLWIVSIVILASTISSYIWLASFLTSRLVHAAIVIAGAYVVINFVNAYFEEGMDPRSQRGRNFASTLGIRSQSLSLAAALLAGVARVAVVLVALFLIVGNWGTSLTDLVASFDRASFGVEFGTIRLSLYDVVISLAVLIVGIVLARILQSWLANTIFPRTRLDTSLKNSIATIAGYIGIIAAISIALARLGLNLENIALIAGALSVGIGFGLQAIVSNFVSGLILLTERPIKVGDMVNVKGSEGYVRRISVRSTEVETYDRASVIIPNSEFITSAVTNWTHKNPIARITVKVGVSYDSDVEQVREILINEAKSHKRVLSKPEPAVFFMNFGDSALNFELRCIIDSADFMLSTKSDLHFAILRAFREAKIEIPFPQQDLRIIDPTGNGAAVLRRNGDGAHTSDVEGPEPTGGASKR